MRMLNITADARTNFPKLSLSIATTREELREIQRLRYRVFIEAMGLTILSNDSGLDADEYDAYCDHLIVCDSSTLKVVGTYRLLSTANAREIGSVHSEKQFDLAHLNHFAIALSKLAEVASIWTTAMAVSSCYCGRVSLPTCVGNVVTILLAAPASAWRAAVIMPLQFANHYRGHIWLRWNIAFCPMYRFRSMTWKALSTVRCPSSQRLYA